MRHDTRIRRVLVACVVLAGCNAESALPDEWAGTVSDSADVVLVVNPTDGVWTPGSAWQLEEELRIGAAHGDPVREFGRVAGIAVNARGEIHVLDRQAREIRVFDPDGEYLRTIGREGSGPGELAGPSTVLIAAGDTILVPDMANQRVQRFLPDGSEGGTFPVPLTAGIPLGWYIREDGLLLEEVRTLPGAPGGGREAVLLRVRAMDGQVGESLIEMPVGEAMVLRGGQQEVTVFAPESRWAPLVDGRIATGWNAEYQLHFRAPDGRVERVVRKPFERRAFTESHRRALQELFQQQFAGQPPSPATDRMLQSMRYADYYPAFTELFGGPYGTVWVRHAREVPSLDHDDMNDFDARGVGASDYDVIDDTGRFLGTISTPRRFEPMITQGDRIYGVERDELGVQHVVQLRVVR